MASLDEQIAEAEARFTTDLKLAEAVAKSAAKNKKLRPTLLEVAREAKAGPDTPKPQGALIYTVAVKFPQNALVHRPTLLAYIADGRLKANNQLDAALEHLSAVAAGPLDAAAFEEAAGVGVEVTPEQVAAAVAEVVTANEAALRELRYTLNTTILLAQARERVKWAEVAAVKAELDAQVARLLGPKTEADVAAAAAPKKKTKPSKAPKPAAAAGAADLKPAEAEESWRNSDPFAFLPRPEANNGVHTTVHFSDERGRMDVANTAEQLERHLRATGGRVRTRFPPEPNGYLHVGHGKACFVDFGCAAQYGGECILRFDDTNPEAEKQEFIDHIQDIVSWLGWTPAKVTYSSDYFPQLHALAVRLIELGHAYVCHQTGEQIKASREARQPSPWRDRTIAENLALFDEMRRGLWDEGTATLRMKQDIKNENYNMFDLIAYRVKFVEHPKAGNAWCIYPSYDFTHCLVDSLENISHSLCTLEFESRRTSYYWLLEVLGMYKPVEWEYSRLNMANAVMSKRKLLQLVQLGKVSGWDDPRMMTLSGMRRRGITPQAINNFCREMGVTRSDNIIRLHTLEHHVRSDLEENAARALAVLRPLRVVITNLTEGHVEQVQAKVYPQKKGSTETYEVPFSRVVYIERTDFREQDSKDFYGMAPGKSIMLRYAYPITCTGYSKNEAGNVAEVTAEYDAGFAGKKPPKGVLNWVAEPQSGQSPPRVELRLYDVLFSGEDPAGSEDWLGDLNPNSLEVVPDALASPPLLAAKPGDRFQLERLGYFMVDSDTRPGAMVLNRTCTLKEGVAKKNVGRDTQQAASASR
mmetsp:Transcript_551/g.1641  ORF Transcript_551/g.1641 Transcript_551/m.1641 type:complete len:812 (+) Transcript_551:162-2597(+)|eukprot:CAMPEP_0206148602 /NCGR_PEP_ID=MMETSP1473-20131121/37101_1 /ASSEMBLY_ACC=CAM_ASM_001109 /TAXON_ID=1461547 /ORGANISM="Stichococcus sp, Strain RCC1054" /LENGTH=811 /DNA_ID=CAMNT_0053545993 /DNA_START=94 /DNA_END=2529 /DNA_ORIENTATION=-